VSDRSVQPTGYIQEEKRIEDAALMYVHVMDGLFMGTRITLR